MSEIKVNSIKGVGASVAAITIDNSSGACTANITNNLSNRNLIINGDMQIWQRSSSVSVVDAGAEGYQSVDRYYNSYVGAANGVYTISKSTEAPDGFGSSIKYDVTTVNSNVSSGNKVIYLYQNIEAQNIYNSGWKQTSTSNYLTFSFWFKTNKSGTNKLPIFFQEGDNSYSYVTDITVSDTNWNRYSLTVPGNAGLTIPNDNGTGLKVGMAFAVGDGFQTTADQWNNSREYGTSNSTNWFDNTSNEWYTTGWQVEVGDHATDFEHRSYAQELALCQRYFYMHASGAEAASSNKAPIATGAMYNSGNWNGVINFPVKMRTSPSLYKVEGTDYFIIWGDGGNDSCNSVLLDSSSPQSGTANLTGGLAQTSGTSHWATTYNSATRLGFQAEL